MLNKLAKNTIAVIAIIILIVFTIMSLFYIVTVKNYFENVFIDLTTSLGLFKYLLIDIVLLILLKILDLKLSKDNKKVEIAKKILLIVSLIIYAFVSISWIKSSTIEPIDDSKSVNDLAIKFAEGDFESIKNNGYIEKYPNQIGTISIFALLYKVFGTTNFRLIQYVNVLANIITILFIYFIVKKLEKKYPISKVGSLIMTLTFIPLILLTTYVYGDYIGLAFSVMGIYFIIDYKQKEKIFKLLLSAICMSIAYFTKMNYIIVIIAMVIYLGLYLIQEKEKKKIAKSIVNIIIFACITLIPFNLVKSYCSNKFGYDPSQAIPTSVWVYIGMNESYRANGWYSDLANEAWEDTPLAHYTYPQKIKARIKEFLQKPKYTYYFYKDKTISGWMDPYFESIWYNVVGDDKDQVMKQIMEGNKYKKGEIYQKAITILIYGGALIAMIKNRKDLNNELILIITIFIGGVLFHTIWEMKSRYTLPYVIMLIPASSIGIQYIVDKINLKKFFTKDVKKLTSNSEAV